MKVTDKKIEACEALLTIEMDSADMQTALENAYQRLVKRTEVPGFRKGKTPRPILERYLGKDRLIEESLDEVLPKACADAIKEQDIKAFGTPGVEVVQNEPLIFKAKIPLPPNVELGDYKSIRMAPEPVEVKEEVVDGMIKQLRHEKATWEPVDRPAQEGDLVVMDLESTIDGAPFINQKGAQFGVSEESKYPAPGFSQAIFGLSRDDTKEFQLKYPDDFAKVELGGKEPLFKVKIIEIKEEKLPPEDDDFAKSLDVDMTSFDELKNRMRDNYRKRLENSAAETYEAGLVDELVHISKAEFPPNLVDMEYERLVNQQLDRWQQQVSSQAEYEELLGRINPEDLARQLRPRAEDRVRRSLILGKLATAENLEVSDEDIDADVERMMATIPEDKRDEQRPYFEKPEAREEIAQILLSRKTIERLKDIAAGKGGETAPATADEKTNEEITEEAKD
ncbi:trigger factor [Dehalogenimonas sp. THU2]|uniref:trigger factor n=1 Tax=Dehalogenimonas sp. THU2 TaxID=3151121 RepID=UPI0032186871